MLRFFLALLVDGSEFSELLFEDGDLLLLRPIFSLVFSFEERKFVFKAADFGFMAKVYLIEFVGMVIFNFGNLWVPLEPGQDRYNLAPTYLLGVLHV